MFSRVLTAIAAVGIATAGIASGASSASAAVGPGEDRQLSSPTAWWTYNGLTAAQVSATLQTNNARLTDLKVDYSGATLKFTVTEVRNTGAYASAWWWYYGITPSQVVSISRANSARPTVATCYQVSGTTRCAVIMIGNTGANAEPWSFWVGTASYIDAKVNANYNRLLSYSRVQGTSYYSAVLASNTGSDGTAWWYYRGLSSTQVSYNAWRNHARVIDLDHNDDTGTYNAVMYANPAGTPSSLRVLESLNALMVDALLAGQRLFDVSPYVSGGQGAIAGLMVNNR